MKDADCVAFLQWVLPRLGLAWSGYRKVRRQVCKRIARRLRELGLADSRAYREHLESHPAEWQTLAGLCTVSISRFYRDRAVFDCLGKKVFPALARGAPRLECWSAGCASGEEPYTLAIQAGLGGIELRVLGTDVDARLIERARNGCYRAASLKELPAGWREQAFEQRGESFCVKPRFRGGVEFGVQDLLEQLPQRTFDLILCRNLAFTYFDAERARRSLERIASRLNPGGALVIGIHEKLPVDAGFAAWPGCRAVYRLA